MSANSSTIILIGEKILLSIWVGGMWGVGYLVAPFLFSKLSETALAGYLVGELIKTISLVGVVVLVSILIRLVWQLKTSSFRHWLFWCVSVALGLLLLNILLLYPEMAALKIAGIENGTERTEQFNRLHGASAMSYLLVSIAGLFMISNGLRSEPDSI